MLNSQPAESVESTDKPNHGAGGINHPAGSIFFNTIHRKMNHVNLIGKMTSTPRFYEQPSGRKVAQFTMSTNETYLDAEGNTKNKNHWHRMSAWGRWVQVLEELPLVGMEIAIEGKLTTRFYMKGEEKRFISEVEVNDLIIL
ncbi:MAG: single-stranded DNA-binding protein [Crocinitomicaceae bacterium]|nr:single-stranded DNA-binding protein [Crocinitomicaceae bacterium]